jgi:hypothetical protein
MQQQKLPRASSTNHEIKLCKWVLQKKAFVDFRDGVQVIKCCALGCNCDLTFEIHAKLHIIVLSLVFPYCLSSIWMHPAKL